ncbi:hypothetical protein GCM10028805_02940 [Spirosoma harenae]
MNLSNLLCLILLTFFFATCTTIYPDALEKIDPEAYSAEAINLGFKIDNPTLKSRDADYSKTIFSASYVDQPYTVVLPSGKWFCVLTLGVAAEGSDGETVKYSISENKGISWSMPKVVESDTLRSASYAIPYLAQNKRLYVIYNFNGDNVRQLNGKKIRNDMLGWCCYRYSDDEGKTWSSRYRIPIPVTKADTENDWQGKVQMFWSVAKPIRTKDGMYFNFSKIKKYVIDDSEGWVMFSPNIDYENKAENIIWKMLPGNDTGLKTEALGRWQEEHNMVELSDGTLYCVFRTGMGYAGYAVSSDKGTTWSTGAPITLEDGTTLRHPRACVRIWKCKNGKYLLWCHNNSQGLRNPAWIMGGVEQNGSIKWSQPEVILYKKDRKGQLTYPDLLEDNNQYWITVTHKDKATISQIDPYLLEAIWSQGTVKDLVKDNLAFDHIKDRTNFLQKVTVPRLDQGGFSIEIKLKFNKFNYGEILVDNRSLDSLGRQKGIVVLVGKEQNLILQLNNGIEKLYLNTDINGMQANKIYNVGFVVDGDAGIISSTINGKLCSKAYTYTGWQPLRNNDIDINSNANVKISSTFSGTINAVRIYNRPLLTSELMSNFLSDQ